MNRRRQPFFYAVLLIVFVAAARADPSSENVSSALAAAYRVSYYAASIVLAAAPFVLAGALASFAVLRLRLRGTIALLAAALAPGCDCSMNGFAPALTRSPAPLAGAALVFGAACNPLALATTAAVLGIHLTAARAAGAAAAAGTLWFLWRWWGREPEARDVHASCADDSRMVTHLERGLRSLVPAALVGALLAALFAGRLPAHASAPIAAMIGAALSPCSSADPVLASVLGREAPTQAAFMIASQCLDVRLLALLHRHFGPRRTLLAAIAGTCGCVAGALVAR